MTSRRTFLVAGGAASATALVVGFRLWPTIRPGAMPGGAAAKARINPVEAWLRIDADGTVRIYSPKAEMGQGVMTSLPMILAEELDVDFASVRVEQAPTNRAFYNHGTGGSNSIRGSYKPLRQAGASARQMLVAAAAARFGVPAAECRTQSGSVIHDGSAKRARYGELVADAAKLPVPDPETVPLKDPAKFKIIGQSLPRFDVPAKVDGSAGFGLDVRVPGMLYAVIARCPVFGGKPKSFDATRAKAVRGVRDVFEIPAMSAAKSAGGVAVVAESTWAAIRGARALDVVWDLGPDAAESTDALRERMRAALGASQKAYRSEGDAEGALGKGAAGTVLDAEYELPFLAHAAMEPLNTTAHFKDGAVEIHSPTQGGSWTQDTVSESLGIPVEKIVVHATLLGGGFGRKSIADVAVEAVQVSQKMAAPVQVVWTREDDMQHDFYRPASLHRLKAALDAAGRPLAWWHRMTSTSINAWFEPGGDLGGGEVGGAENLPYAIPNLRFEYADTKSSVPRAWWRSVEHSMNAFVIESFVDELAAAAKADPLAFRLSLLEGDRAIPMALDKEEVLSTKRLRAVLELAADKAGWARPLPRGRGRGIAAHFAFGSYVAQVAEVSVANGKVSVHRVVCAVDCGRVIHPDGVAQQVESAIAYGLSAALKNEITIAEGRVVQGNFGDYNPLRIDEMPHVEVHLIVNDELPTGMGEPGLPPIAAAVGNAVFALTGKRVRKLPIRLDRT